MSDPSNAPIVIELWPRESECCICGKHLFGCKLAIAMYEGLPVPHDWHHEWGGFDACRECFDKHERGELQMHPGIKDL